MTNQQIQGSMPIMSHSLLPYSLHRAAVVTSFDELDTKGLWKKGKGRFTLNNIEQNPSLASKNYNLVHGLQFFTSIFLTRSFYIDQIAATVKTCPKTNITMGHRSRNSLPLLIECWITQNYRG